MRDNSHDTAMAKIFQDDPSYLIELLNRVLTDGNFDELSIILHQALLGMYNGADSDFGKYGGADDLSIQLLQAKLKAIGLRLTICKL